MMKKILIFSMLCIALMGSIFAQDRIADINQMPSTAINLTVPMMFTDSNATMSCTYYDSYSTATRPLRLYSIVAPDSINGLSVFLRYSDYNADEYLYIFDTLGRRIVCNDDQNYHGDSTAYEGENGSRCFFGVRPGEKLYIGVSQYDKLEDYEFDPYPFFLLIEKEDSVQSFNTYNFPTLTLGDTIADTATSNRIPFALSALIYSAPSEYFVNGYATELTANGLYTVNIDEDRLRIYIYNSDFHLVNETNNSPANFMAGESGTYYIFALGYTDSLSYNITISTLDSVPTFYVSDNGDPSNEGTSPDAPYSGFEDISYSSSFAVIYVMDTITTSYDFDTYTGCMHEIRPYGNEATIICDGYFDVEGGNLTLGSDEGTLNITRNKHDAMVYASSNGNVNFKNVNFQGYKYSSIVEASHSTLTLNNVAFDSCDITSPYFNLAFGSSLNMNGMTVTNCVGFGFFSLSGECSATINNLTATGDSIFYIFYTNDNSTLTLDSSNVSNSSVTAFGGVFASTANVNNSVFANNSSDAGFICDDNAAFTLNNDSILNNFFEEGYMGVYEDAVTTVNDVVIKGNASTYPMYTIGEGAVLRLTNGEMTENIFLKDSNFIYGDTIMAVLNDTALAGIVATDTARIEINQHFHTDATIMIDPNCIVAINNLALAADYTAKLMPIIIDTVNGLIEPNYVDSLLVMEGNNARYSYFDLIQLDTATTWFIGNDGRLTTVQPEPVVDGIAEAEAQTISIYPNPATDQLHISADGISEVVLMDMQGRIAMKQTVNGETTMNIASLARGIYFLQLRDSNSIVATKKVIKK